MGLFTRCISTLIFLTLELLALSLGMRKVPWKRKQGNIYTEPGNFVLILLHKIFQQGKHGTERTWDFTTYGIVIGPFGACDMSPDTKNR